MQIVDTNIVAALFLESKFNADARALFELDPAWCTEPFALTEFCNVLATYQRTGKASEEDARKYYEAAEMFLMPHLNPIPRKTVLSIAMKLKVTAYDAHFLAVAEARGRKLVTEDLRLRAAAPKLTQSLDEALASLC